jgi:hypothetical protein
MLSQALYIFCLHSKMKLFHGQFFMTEIFNILYRRVTEHYF